MDTDYATRAELHAVRDELRGEIRAVGVVAEDIRTQVEALGSPV